MVGEKLLARSHEMIGSYGTIGVHPDQADAFTIATGRCKLINQSLELFTLFCYQTNDLGFYVNLSGNTAIPTGIYTPFGAAGKPRGAKEAKAQLTKDERLIVRFWLQELKKARRFPLFFYHQPARRWHVDTVRYDTQADAIQWLKANQLDAKTFLQLRQKMR